MPPPIADLFPDVVVCEAIDPAQSEAEAELFPEEAALVARALDKRRREFAAGRLCYRRALARLGLPPRALVNDADRAPMWPEDVVGSVTHTRGLCAVVLAPADTMRSLGIDVEPSTPMRDALWRRIATADEQRRIEASSAIEPGLMGKIVFSAKECFYKLQYPLTRQYLGFEDAEVAVDLEGGRFDVTFLRDAGDRFRRGDVLDGRFRIDDGYVVTAMHLER